MKAKIKRFALRALSRMDGTPMPNAALVDSIRLAVPEAAGPNIDEAIAELKAARLIDDAKDDLTETVTWMLTTLGHHKAKQLE